MEQNKTVEQLLEKIWKETGSEHPSELTAIDGLVQVCRLQQGLIEELKFEVDTLNKWYRMSKV